VPRRLAPWAACASWHLDNDWLQLRLVVAVVVGVVLIVCVLRRVLDVGLLLIAVVAAGVFRGFVAVARQSSELASQCAGGATAR
jgi:hypothetical protein